jgi:hypothetical protein
MPLHTLHISYRTAIKNFIPRGHTFNGVPFQFTRFTSPARMMTTMLDKSDASQLILAQGEGIRFGLSVKIFPYAEVFK